MMAATLDLTSDAAKAWDAAAAGWDRHSGHIRTWLHEPTAAMLDAAGVRAGSRVLDVAAGAGDQSLDIAARVGLRGRLLITDLSAGILTLAEQKLRAAGYMQVEARRADAQQLNMRGADFDAAVCRLGLMFCTSPLLALQGIHEALVPGGGFSGLVFAGPERNPCIATLGATAMRHAGLASASPFKPGTLMSLGQPGLMHSLLAAAGFVDIDIRALDAPMRLPSVKHYLDFVQTAGLPIMAILAPLPTAVQAAAWQDIEAQLLRFNSADDWVGPNELLLCTATRPMHGHAESH
jgi:ubiquinone/menaquinone biosynthesis C-methylase UbiE